jgi:hypothetical protein
MSTSKINDSSSKKQVLVIGMLDSIHLYRWLEQFKNENIEFSIFASKKYRYINPLLLDFINTKSISKSSLATTPSSRCLSGFLDYAKYELFKKFNSRAKSLSRLLKSNSYDYVHGLEIQGAGYLLAQVNTDLLKGTKVILTNWGSDIFYFQQFQEDERMIRRALSKSDFYSAECERDYRLARDFGFLGKDLPCIPNAGGYQINESHSTLSTSERKQIMIKGYGGRFGRADIPVNLIPQMVASFPNSVFFIYSVTDDVLELINRLPREIKKLIRISTVKDRMLRDDFLLEFGKSRIYIGCSKSDGISTSFLEAIIHGTYPIQTSTSCAGEWVAKGYVASLTDIDPSQILDATLSALHDDDLVDRAARININLAKKDLSYTRIRDKALTFYTQ